MGGTWARHSKWQAGGGGVHASVLLTNRSATFRAPGRPTFCNPPPWRLLMGTTPIYSTTLGLVRTVQPPRFTMDYSRCAECKPSCVPVDRQIETSLLRADVIRTAVVGS